MRPVPIITAGLFAAALGAALWAVIGYYLHVEVGWIAIIIGAVVGMVCRAAAKDEAGVESGIIAAFLTVVAILGGKLAMSYALTHRVDDVDFAISAVADQILFEHAQQGRTYRFPENIDPQSAVGQEEYPPELWTLATTRWHGLSGDEQTDLIACPALANPDYVISYIADEIVVVWTDQGRTLRWPGGSEPELPQRASDYPADVWTQARARWDELDETARRARVDEVIASSQLGSREVESIIFWTVFKATFGVLDIVFVGIGVLAALKLGGGLSEQ